MGTTILILRKKDKKMITQYLKLLALLLDDAYIISYMYIHFFEVDTYNIYIHR